MRCPACEAPIDEVTGTCAGGHPLRDEAGVIRLVPSDFAARLEALEAAVVADRRRRGRHPLPSSALAQLPDGPATAGDHEWRLRRHDLALVRRVLDDRPGARVLDVGAWNGWLSARLAADGHRATGVDLFAGPEFLGAHAHATADWRAVQLDLTDLARIEERFDLVVLNRGIQFFPDPVEIVAHATERVAPGGRLVVTGLSVFRSPRAVAERVTRVRAEFRSNAGMDLMVYPSKGYLDTSDLQRLEAFGLTTRPYPGLRLANLRARFDSGRPEYRYGLLEVAGR